MLARMKMDIKHKRILLKKRAEYPKFRSYGHLSTHTIEHLLNEFYNNQLFSALDEAIQRRNSSAIELDVTKLDGYDQFKLSKDVPELHQFVKNPRRLRFSFLEAGKSIHTHIDQPEEDRFIVLLKGKHLITVNGSAYTSVIGEIVYINASHYHSVKNLDGCRIALLGVFDYEH